MSLPACRHADGTISSPSVEGIWRMVSEDSDELVPGFITTKSCVTLLSGRVAASARPAWLPNEADREASFSVYKTDHPTTRLNQSFLLIFRTRHIVTVDAKPDVHSSAGYTGFPAFGQMRTASLPIRGATIAGLCTCPFPGHISRDMPFRAYYLRTVIVTAAVYRGLDSKLRPKTNLSS
jgi:hypothetical protein